MGGGVQLQAGQQLPIPIQVMHMEVIVGVGVLSDEQQQLELYPDSHCLRLPQ